jgi:hypothetical protein
LQFTRDENSDPEIVQRTHFSIPIKMTKTPPPLCQTLMDCGSAALGVLSEEMAVKWIVHQVGWILVLWTCV